MRTSAVVKGVAGVGIAAALTTGLVVVDQHNLTPAAHSSPASSTASSAAKHGLGSSDSQALAKYLKSHPKVQAQITHIMSLPADQRASARQAFLAAHPQLKADLKAARSGGA